MGINSKWLDSADPTAASVNTIAPAATFNADYLIIIDR